MKWFQTRTRVLSACLAILVVLLAGVYYFQNIEDWWSLQGYTPSTAIKTLAQDDTMTPQAQHLFYVANATVDSRQVFNAHCSNKGDNTIVLGCYTGGTNGIIYIYDVTQPQLNGIQQVTAAHEMLHVVYARLGSQKTSVDNLLRAQMKETTDPRLLQLESIYSTTEPGELLDEMFSVFGTQVATLNPDLQAIYNQYFTNRQVLVNYTAAYVGLFQQNNAEIVSIDSQLKTLNTTIQSDNAQLTSQQQGITSMAQTMNGLKSSGQVGPYNQDVGPYNQKVDTFNSLLTTDQQLINQYNQLVAQRNQIATATNQLNNDLNSRFTTLSAQGQ
ncbi:MAG TPA: hypothetical protein VGS28_02710 [Candidatus Saccharimonadales bacterium]|nr:hypothetical protein [Candidatus Saccharimonadales bacterium]